MKRASKKDVEAVLSTYPAISFACQMRQVRDPRQGTLSLHLASILDHLDDLAPTSVQDLASHMGVTPSTMSIHVDKLESGGYLRRARDSNDQRRTELRLTRAGARVKLQQKLLDPKLVEAVLRRLGEIDRKKALEGLELMAAAARDFVASNQFRKAVRGGPGSSS